MAVLCSRFFDLPKSPVHIYGVERDWTSSGPAKGVRADDAAGFGDPNPAVNTASNAYSDIGCRLQERPPKTI